MVVDDITQQDNDDVIIESGSEPEEDMGDFVVVGTVLPFSGSVILGDVGVSWVQGDYGYEDEIPDEIQELFGEDPFAPMTW